MTKPKGPIPLTRAECARLGTAAAVAKHGAEHVRAQQAANMAKGRAVQSARAVSPIRIAERFWSKLDYSSPTGCWLWLGSPKRDGYGEFAFGTNPQRRVLAHRVAWEFTHGPIPDGLCVLHHCDNPPCCRPSHLFLGTKADNSADMTAKGRHHPGSQRLVPQQVLAIRDRYSCGGVTMAALAAEYGVTVSHIHGIVRGHSWPKLKAAP